MRPAPLAIALLLLFSSAAAGKEPPPPAPPPAPAPTPPTFEALVLEAGKLPAGMKLVDGVHPVSIQPNTFYERPEMQGMMPAPVHKAAQSFAKEGRSPGTVYVFEYGSAEEVDKLEGFLAGLLYGEGKRSAQHPEEVVRHGVFLFIISFPIGDPAAEWYKERLRREFGIRAPCSDSPERLALGRKLYAAYEKADVAAAKQLLADNPAMFEDWVLGQYFLAETGMEAEDGEFAEAHFVAAIDLHESRRAIFDDDSFCWLCHDGVGISLLIRKKYADAVKAFEHAREVGKQLAVQPAKLASTDYNLACAYARLKKWDKSLKALEAAIAGDPKWKEKAATDADLAEAVKRKEFKALLAR